jgi:hypothetical protein
MSFVKVMGTFVTCRKRLALMATVSAALLFVGCGKNSPPMPLGDSIGLGVTLDHDTLSTADFRGKVLLVVLWTTWCHPCSLADLDSVWAAFAPTDSFALVAVSLDENEEHLRSYLGDQSHEFTITMGLCCIRLQDFDAKSVPTYQLFDARGFKKWHSGASPSASIIEMYVRRELDQLGR